MSLPFFKLKRKTKENSLGADNFSRIFNMENGIEDSDFLLTFYFVAHYFPLHRRMHTHYQKRALCAKDRKSIPTFYKLYSIPFLYSKRDLNIMSLWNSNYHHLLLFPHYSPIPRKSIYFRGSFSKIYLLQIKNFDFLFYRYVSIPVPITFLLTNMKYYLHQDLIFIPPNFFHLNNLLIFEPQWYALPEAYLCSSHTYIFSYKKVIMIQHTLARLEIRKLHNNLVYFHFRFSINHEVENFTMINILIPLWLLSVFSNFMTLTTHFAYRFYFLQ